MNYSSYMSTEYISSIFCGFDFDYFVVPEKIGDTLCHTFSGDLVGAADSTECCCGKHKRRFCFFMEYYMIHSKIKG